MIVTCGATARQRSTAPAPRRFAGPRSTCPEERGGSGGTLPGAARGRPGGLLCRAGLSSLVGKLCGHCLVLSARDWPVSRPSAIGSLAPPGPRQGSFRPSCRAAVAGVESPTPPRGGRLPRPGRLRKTRAALDQAALWARRVRSARAHPGTGIRATQDLPETDHDVPPRLHRHAKANGCSPAPRTICGNCTGTAGKAERRPLTNQQPELMITEHHECQGHGAEGGRREPRPGRSGCRSSSPTGPAASTPQ